MAETTESLMQAALERLLFATRWLLVPLYLALGVAVLALIAKAGQRVYELAIAFPASSESSVMLGALGIVDLTLTASLVVIVIFPATSISSRGSTRASTMTGRNGWPGSISANSSSS